METNGGDSTPTVQQKPVAHVKPILATASTPSPHNSPSPLPKQPSPNYAVQQMQRMSLVHSSRAKKCRFVRNGDRFFRGIHLAISSERFRNYDSLLEEVTRLLKGTECMPLPSGVRVLYSLKDGHKVRRKNMSKHLIVTEEFFHNVTVK
jgi:Doublecortin